MCDTYTVCDTMQHILSYVYNTSLEITSLVQLFFNGIPEFVDKVKKFHALISWFAFIEQVQTGFRRKELGGIEINHPRNVSHLLG